MAQPPTLSNGRKGDARGYAASPLGTLPHREHPVSDADLEALADAALGSPEEDELEEMADLALRGGAGDDHSPGFGDAVADARARTARLARRRLPHVRDVLSARRKATFLANLAVTGNVTMAASAAGWSRGIPGSLRRADADFAAKWEHALETAGDLLEAEALRRAVHGVSKPVFGRVGSGEGATTEVVGHTVEYSDSLLITLLKATKPEKYRERVEQRIEGNKGGVLVVPAAPAKEDWEARAKANQAQYREEKPQ